MTVNRDFRDLFAALNAAGAEIFSYSDEPSPPGYRFRFRWITFAGGKPLK